MSKEKEPIKDILDGIVEDNKELLTTKEQFEEHNKNIPFVFVPNDNVERELITFMQNKYGFNLEGRIIKLHEEFNELIMELAGTRYKNVTVTNHEINKDKVIDEIGDCMAVMLHITHSFGVESTEILSRTLHKLKQREINPMYKHESKN